MMRTYLQRLFEHLFWADSLVLELLRGWPAAPGEGDADADEAARERVIRLVAHILGAERVWLLRLRGEESATQPIWPDPTLAELEALSAENRAGYTELLATATDAWFEQAIDYRNTAGIAFRTPIADILTHVALHASYHRGQVARDVRAAGREPVNTDYITWVRSVGAHP